VPTDPPAQRAAGDRGPKHLTEDWKKRNAAGPLAFELHWIPFVNERETPIVDLTTAWNDRQKVRVGTVVFPQVDPGTRDAKLAALLASELGANPGHWQEAPDDSAADLPSTRFTAARALAYRVSQQHRSALAEESYRSFFDKGEVSAALASTLIARYKEKRGTGQWMPDLGEL